MLNNTPGAGTVSTAGHLPVSHLKKVLDFAEAEGVSTVPFLAAVDLTPAVFAAGEGEIPYETYMTVVEQLLASADLPALGFKVGRTYNDADFGILGYALLSSKNVRSALETHFKFQRILGNEAVWESYRVNGHSVILTVDCNLPPGAFKRFEAELAVGQFTVADVVQDFSFASQFTRVNFDFPKPDYTGEFAAVIDCPIHYDRPATEVHFPVELLDQPYRLANDVAQALCEERCRAILERLEEQGGLVEQVRRFIVNSPGEVPSLEAVAEALTISPRSLRRRLQGEGASYQNILNEVRMSLATDYLHRTKLTSQDIANLLGYTEVANFHRAFKKWCHMTPRAYREAQRTA